MATTAPGSGLMERRTSWREVHIEIASEAAELVAAAASDVADGIELRDGGTLIKTAQDRVVVVAHVAPDSRATLLAAIEETAARARAAGLTVDPIVVHERDAHEDEWRDVWKQFFRATRVGRTFLVRPSWDPGAVAAGDRVIDLDPGRAFGTGGHASTRLVMALAEGVADARAAAGGLAPRFLDLGCGSGILSIAAARLWPDAMGFAVDTDPEATACAQENFARNGIDRVTVVTGSLADVPREPGLDLVLANIQADVLAPLAGELSSRIVPGGHAILSGLLLRDADPMSGLFREAGFDLLRRQDEGDWAALELRRGARAPA